MNLYPPLQKFTYFLHRTSEKSRESRKCENHYPNLSESFDSTYVE